MVAHSAQKRKAERRKGYREGGRSLTVEGKEGAHSRVLPSRRKDISTIRPLRTPYER